MGKNAILGTVPGTVSFEENTPAIQQYLLRGISQQINCLQYPKLELLQQMYTDAGLILTTRTDNVNAWSSVQRTHDAIKNVLRENLTDELKLKAISTIVLSAGVLS